MEQRKTADVWMFILTRDHKTSDGGPTENKHAEQRQQPKYNTCCTSQLSRL